MRILSALLSGILSRLIWRRSLPRPTESGADAASERYCLIKVGVLGVSSHKIWRGSWFAPR
jgi:hypothetical protein